MSSAHISKLNSGKFQEPIDIFGLLANTVHSVEFDQFREVPVYSGNESVTDGYEGRDEITIEV